jgi:carbon-monoxide dehydrogenase iron sulfur subunit
MTISRVDKELKTEQQPAPAGRIVFTPNWCRTCRLCETVCSISREGRANPALSRIRIHFDEFSNVDPLSARICLHCEDAPCMDACRVGAMARDDRTGAVVILEDKCIGCMRCAKACPWQIPVRHPEQRRALKCDLCSHRPEGPLCVEMCPLSGKALRYEADAQVGGDGHV